MNKFILQNILLAMALTVFANGAIAADKSLGNTHKAAGVECSDCHETKPPQAVPMFKCLECHDTKDLAETTKNVMPTNPHENRHFSTETDCTYCHNQHKASENYCGGCHLRFDFVVP
ncbi:cytochrome c3 family protein [Shewanella japonica]|uniref:cytochrome c3 family protein n=1 Tax=Shewanella japonica TaxID=93973 RepID=UPI000E718C4F|nr:cytochrome c3 family protein [Shewanella japonica]